MVIGNSNKIFIPKSYRSLKVLLVGNDHTTYFNYVKSTLEQYSYKVTNEESPAVALSLVGETEEGSKYYDLVITDMDLMELDHFRFFNHIILNTQLPIILMSCDENSDVLRKALSQAVCFFLRKPIRPQVLASVWQHVFRVRRMQTMHNMNGQGKQIHQENDIWEENNIEINGESSQVESKVHATDSQNLSNDDARLVTNQEKEDCLRKSDEDDDDDDDDDENDIGDERLNKKPRMSWTDELRLQFEKAIKILGEEKARPKEILKLMGISNVTLRHVSSHLQKYREKKKRTGINCATAQPHQFKLTNMDSRMQRQYQNGKPWEWDLLDLNSKKSPVAETMIQPTSQYVRQQHNTESSSVHYQIDMVKKLLDKAKGTQTNNYDDIEGYMKGGYNKELTVGKRSSMNGSNPNEGEANIFRHKEFSENISAMILNPDSAAANSEPYVPDIYEDYLASNDCSDVLHHLNMDMGNILSEPNGSGFLEDIILSSQGLEN